MKRRRRLRFSPQAATWLLALALAGAAVALLGHTPEGPLLAVHLPWAVLVVAVLFAAAEIAYVSIEFRRQSYSFTIAGVPLVLGLLSSSTWQVVAVATLGPAVVLAVQRLPIIKITYNIAAFGFETALAGFVLHRSSHFGVQLSARGASVLCGVVAAVDLLMSALVLVLIRLHGQRVGLREALGTLVPAALFNGVALTYATVTAVLLADGPLGWVLLAALSLAGIGTYRAYTVLAARHHSLGLVNSFVEDGAGTGNVEELAALRLARIRELLRAGSAQVILGAGVLGGAEDHKLQRLAVDDEGSRSARGLARSEVDWLSTRVLDQDEAVLIPRGTKDPDLRRWLEDRDVRDAILVPLPFGDATDGVVAVTDRLADHTTFTTDDLTLLRTLAGHLGVALRSTRLLQRLREDATHDALTGLPNRVLFQELLEATRSDAGDDRPAVLLIGLSGFKEVNDALGHDMGDRLLRVVGQRLTAAVPDGAVVARLGGDEFAVLVPGSVEPGSPAAAGRGTGVAEAPEALSMRLAGVIAEPVVLDEARVSLVASVGIAVPEGAGSGGPLLRQADTAMSAAKAAGVTAMRYTPQLDRGKAERLALVADLRSGLDRGELLTLFQPKVDLRSRTVVGAEALVRWNHPSRGRLAPDLFIPLAESTGLIEPLTSLVLRDAVRACRGWRDAGLVDVSVSVNVSPRTLLDDGFPALVAAALDEAGLPPQALILEITEGVLMGDQKATIAVLDALVASGVRMSLDDFGTGYSSLAYLQRLPVQEIKIDRSFVSDFASAGDGERAGALVSSVIGLAAAFDLTVVAEGIEDARTLERLAALGCDAAQGYYYGRPAPADTLLDTARELCASAAASLPSPRPAPTAHASRSGS